MLKTQNVKNEEGLQFIEDFIKLLHDCLLQIHEFAKKDTYKNIPEIFEFLVGNLGSDDLNRFDSILDLIGDFFVYSDELCSRAI